MFLRWVCVNCCSSCKVVGSNQLTKRHVTYGTICLWFFIHSSSLLKGCSHYACVCPCEWLFSYLKLRSISSHQNFLTVTENALQIVIFVAQPCLSHCHHVFSCWTAWAPPAGWLLDLATCCHCSCCNSCILPPQSLHPLRKCGAKITGITIAVCCTAWYKENVWSVDPRYGHRK